MMSEVNAEEEFYVACSDDEKYNPTGLPDGAWEPAPNDICELYEKLARGEELELEWTCKGRRSPSPEGSQEVNMEVEETANATVEQQQKTPTEFDFDDIGGDDNPVTPRRTPGATKTPRSVQKRVARLDKILDDISRHKKINKSSGAKSQAAKTPPHGSHTPPRNPSMSPRAAGEIVPETPTGPTSDSTVADTNDKAKEIGDSDAQNASSTAPSPKQTTLPS